jgi:hypothetical protein
MDMREKHEDVVRVPVHRAGTEHPLLWLRAEMNTFFDRYLGCWPTTWEPMGFPERLWNAGVEESDTAITVRAEAPGFEPKEFDKT